MSAELVETSRLWARVNAKIEPEWVEPLAGHLLKRTYSEPHWEKDQAAVMAFEKVTLYGVPIIAQRKVNYGRIDPEASRELFIRNALVEGDWRTHHKFFADNRRLLTEVEELEHRARRRDILVDDETLYDFYDQRVPEHVVSGAHFDSWWKHQRTIEGREPELLDFERSMLINERAGDISKADYPDSWHQGRLKFRVTYQFEPGADADGVTVHIPLQVLNQVTDEGFDWQIPGLREEVVTELIRSLPKPIRRNYVPAPNFAQRFLATANPLQEPLTTTMARELKRMVGVPFTADDFDWSKVPDHLLITFRIVDERRRKIAEDKDLEALKVRLKPKAREAISQAAAATAEREGGESLERKGLTDWTIGTLTRVFETRRAGQPVKAYPALVDDGDTVSVRLFDTEEERRGGGDVEGHAAARRAQHPGEPGEVRVRKAHQRAEARPVRESARFDPGTVRRLRARGGGQTHRRLRRSGMGRGVVPEALREGARRDRRHDGPRGGPGPAGAGRLAGL